MSRETTGRQPSQNDTTPETAKTKKKEGTGHSVRVGVPPTYFHNEKEKKREEEEEPAKKVRRTRKQALALHTRARQSALRATMAQAFLLLLLLSSAPARPLFLNRR